MGHTLLAVVVIGSDVSLLTQNPIHCRPAPLPAISRRWRPIQRELLRNLTNRKVSAHIGVEDPPHYYCLGFLYFCMRLHTVTAVYFPLTLRHIRGDNLGTTLSVTFASSGSFRTLPV